jgi:hypothetical protein
MVRTTSRVHCIGNRSADAALRTDPPQLVRPLRFGSVVAEARVRGLVSRNGMSSDETLQ